MHGGAARNGADSPAFKHGLYSGYMPKGLRADYERLRTDVDLTKLDEELGLLTLRIGGLLETLESSAPAWEAILAEWSGLSQKAGGNLGPEFDGLRKLVCEGAAKAVVEQQTWSEIRQLIQEKTRTAAAEWSRLRDLQGLVKLDMVLTMWRGMLEAIKANVADPVLLKTIIGAVLQYMPAPSVALIEGGNASV